MQRNIVAAVLALGLGLTASGCTLVGYGIGSGLDHLVAPKNGPGWEIEKVKTGKTIELRLSDGTLARGRFVSVLRSFDDTYKKAYEEARRALHERVALPPLGPAEIADTDGQVTDGILTGFDPDCLWFRTAAGAAPVRFDFTHVATIRAEGAAPLASPGIAHLARMGAIPAVSSVQLDAQPPLAPVPLNRIREVSYRGSGGRTAGTLIGGAIDATYLVVIAIACSGSRGCPE